MIKTIIAALIIISITLSTAVILVEMGGYMGSIAVKYYEDYQEWK